MRERERVKSNESYYMTCGEEKVKSHVAGGRAHYWALKVSGFSNGIAHHNLLKSQGQQSFIPK